MQTNTCKGITRHQLVAVGAAASAALLAAPVAHYSWDRFQEACPYSFLDEEMYVWEALWAIRPAARARPFCPASSEGPGGVAGAGGMSA